MSLAIDVDTVKEVLLVDGWHPVLNHSFTLDSYEFMWQHGVIHGGGGQSSVAGFSFSSIGTGGGVFTVTGPLTSILAVRS